MYFPYATNCRMLCVVGHHLQVSIEPLKIYKERITIIKQNNIFVAFQRFRIWRKFITVTKMSSSTRSTISLIVFIEKV